MQVRRRNAVMSRSERSGDTNTPCCDYAQAHENRSQHGTAGSRTRRTFLASCGCAALSVSAFGSSILASITKAEAQAGGAPLKVGHLPAGCVSHLLLAMKRDMFAKAGLNVALTQFNGPAENLQALVAGSLDVMHNPWTT